MIAAVDCSHCVRVDVSVSVSLLRASSTVARVFCAVFSDDSDVLPDKALGPVSFRQADGTLGSITWTAGWPVTVRSSADPWVQASRATNGRMVFGIKDKTLRDRGTILISVGAAALFPFVLHFTMCFCGACIKSCCRRVKDAVDSATRPTFVGAFRDEVSERVSVETRWCEPGSVVGWW